MPTRTRRKSRKNKKRAYLALFKGPLPFVYLALCLGLAYSYYRIEIRPQQTSVGAGREIDLYRSLYARPADIPSPEFNPLTDEKYAMGKLLFFDPRLSKSGTMSCASCHNPAFSWTDAQPKAVGRALTQTPRKTMQLYNLAWDEKFLWDGTMNYLEGQAMMALQAEQGMQMSPSTALKTVKSIKEYREGLMKAFNLPTPEDITYTHIVHALASVERRLVSGTAPFDRWVEGDEDAISEKAKQGFLIFNTKGKCANCHSGWRFSDGNFYNIGVEAEDKGAGLFFASDPLKQYAFKVPGLRNVAVRGPYMHDGHFTTLEQVIAFYNRGGNVNTPNKAPEITPLALTEEEKEALEAFLETLTSETDDSAHVPSRLPR